METQKSEAPVAPEGIAPEAPGNNTRNNPTPPTPAGEPIQNPDAYWKAQAEKFERLLKKAEQEAATAKTQMDGLQEAQTKQIQERLDQVLEEVGVEKAAAETARLEAIRVKALIEKGLDPNMAEFVTAKDAVGIQAQVERLAGLAAPKLKTGRVGNAGSGQQTTDLSWLPGHPTYKGNAGISGGGVTDLEE